jgi:CheY-like chemotaxis protein
VFVPDVQTQDDTPVQVQVQVPPTRLSAVYDRYSSLNRLFLRGGPLAALERNLAHSRVSSVDVNDMGACAHSRSHTRGHLRITVTDNGAGISPEDQKRLFTEIVQFRPEVLQGGGGSGLGLLITKGIVDLHGGRISVHSEGEGKGTTFTVEIPMSRGTGCQCCDSGGMNIFEAAEADQSLPVVARTIENSECPPNSTAADADAAGDIKPSISQCCGRIGTADTRGHSLGLMNSGHGNDNNDHYSAGDILGPKDGFERSIAVLSGVEKGHSEILPTDSQQNTTLLKTHEDNNSSAVLIQTPSDARFSAVRGDDFAEKDGNGVTSLPLLCLATKALERNDDKVSDMKNVATTIGATTTTAAVTVAVAAAAADGKGKNSKGRVYNGPKYSILIVDDSDIGRKMMRKTLAASGHTCDEAEDGVVAVEKVKKRQSSSDPMYDCILMDFVMPNMDGPTATKEIRNMGFDGKILGVTGNGMEADIDYFLACGADRILVKPIDIDMFTAAMSDVDSPPSN